MIAVPPDEFDHLVTAALAEVPDEFRAYLDNVLVEVQDRADRRLQQEHDVPGDILGLYVGTPLEDKMLDQRPATLPDRILIFRRPLCEMCDTYAELIEEIRITVLHEIGHHFGLDEDHLADLGYD